MIASSKRVSANSRVQLLRRHLIRRLPTQEELLRRQGIQLTERDEQILETIYTHGILTTELIELAFFPSPKGERQSPASRAYERLRQLWLWGFVERIEQPVARSLGGSRPYLYTLGRLGEPIVARRIGEGMDPVRRRRLDRMDDVFIDHDLKAAAFWASLMVMTRPRGLPIRWVSERALRAAKHQVQDPLTGRWLPMLPDGYVEIRYPNGGIQCSLLEIDMGTLTLTRFRRKMRALDLYRAQFSNLPKRLLEVLVLTHSAGRMKRLIVEAKKVVPQWRWPRCVFATFEVLDPARDGDGWRTLDGADVNLLYQDPGPPLDAQAPAEQPS